MDAPTPSSPPSPAPVGQPSWIRRALGIIVILAAAFTCWWFTAREDLPHFPLRDGGEFRVVQITYTRRPSDSFDHNLDAPRVRWWIYRQLPLFLQNWFRPPKRGIGYAGSDFPAISIWWAQIDPRTHRPEINEAGDVILILDSGKQINLGWPDPAEGEAPEGPGYRQIFITTPPADSQHLTFDVPVDGEIVHFTIDNPAYQP